MGGTERAVLTEVSVVDDSVSVSDAASKWCAPLPVLPEGILVAHAVGD